MIHGAWGVEEGRWSEPRCEGRGDIASCTKEALKF